MNDSSARTALTVVRVAVAILLGIHGYYRAAVGGVVLFGTFLDQRGFPFGIAWAAAITAFEMAGSVCLLLGRFVRFVAPGHMVILLSGLVMVHARLGWWVVGAGQGGMEFSVLLIACLAALTWDDVARRRGAPPLK